MSKQYPRWMYNQHESVLVHSAEEEAGLKGKYFESPAAVPELADNVKKSGDTSGYVEAPATVRDTRPDPRVPKPVGPGNTQRERLLFQAEGLGMKVDPKWSDETLMRKILEFGSQ